MTELKTSAFLSCGFGDFLAIVTWLTEEERHSIRTIYWATRARELCQPYTWCFFPNVDKQIAVCDSFSTKEKWDRKEGRFCYRYIEEAFEDNLAFNHPHSDISDFGAVPISKEVRDGKRTEWNSPIFWMNVLKLKVTSSYYIIHPFSENFITERRDLGEEDWKAILDKLYKEQRIGIIVNETNLDLIPRFVRNSQWILDATNTLSVFDCVELIRDAYGYIGIASCWSVVAGHLLSPENISIKSVMMEGNKKFYYPKLLPTQIKHPEVL